MIHSYQEEERARLRRQSSRQAIALTMQGRWQEAVAANREIIEKFPDDVDAYNRLGRACMELGEYALAREAYEKAVDLDPYNTIAKRNLTRLSHLGETPAITEAAQHKVEPQQFIEEVGKSGVVRLYRLASPQVLARVVAGDQVDLKTDGASLAVETLQGEYLGLVEPRYAQRLARLVEGGNRYTATIVSAGENAVAVIIREVFQHPSLAGQLSFPPRAVGSYRPHVVERISDRMVRRELELDGARMAEPGYAAVGAEEAETESETEIGTEELLAEEEEEEEETEGE